MTNMLSDKIALFSKIPLSLVFLCFLILSLICPMNAAADREAPLGEVLALGTARPVDGNLAEARKRAISRALKKGVEQVLLTRLGSDGAINNFDRIVSEIMPAARELIQNYHVLSERETGGAYTVLIRVRINEQLVAQRMKAAGVVVVEGPPVKLLFLVSERNGGTARYWWEDPDADVPLSPVELALYREFQERGFAAINRTLGSPEAPGGEELRMADLQTDIVQMWGRLFSAEVVVYGQVETLPENRVSMTLSAVEVETGAVLVEAGKTEPGISTAGDTAVAMTRALAGEMAPAILGAVGTERMKVRRLSVTLTGLRSYQQFSAFKDFLEKSVNGVASVVQTRMRRNSISIDVSFRGDRPAFLDRVLNHERLPLKLEATHTEGNVIVFNVAPEQGQDAAPQ